MRRCDVAVVGGGPAGLACALWLGRFRRDVVVYDTAEPRNEPAWAVHGYPGLLDPNPTELRTRLRRQARTAGATFELDEVTAVRGEKDGFQVETHGGASAVVSRVVLAFGLRDYLPAIPGMAEHYGTAVFHCPDCDGPEAADRTVGVIGWDRAAANLALYLLHWTSRITLLTHGRDPELDRSRLATLERHGIAVRTEVIERLDSGAGTLRGVAFAAGAALPFERLFFHVGSEPRCGIAGDLGCRTDEDGFVDVDRGQQTSSPGVYAIGDITGHPHLAVIAASEGVRAALSIHRSLLPDDRMV
ncbi:MAG TPA: NAD(P)/FAD-dependent oxidoreductase [Longimicrobiales bacterium]|nr:NAD(P)/FAD-dependent oxidoreductase [Longimicrobiales bacterium]